MPGVQQNSLTWVCKWQELTRELHIELALALGAARAAMDVLQIMGRALLAVSAVVLGASMAQRKGPTEPASSPKSNGAFGLSG